MSRSHLYLIILCLFALPGCSTSRPCPPCNPEVEIVKVPHSYPVVLVLELLPPVTLIPVPKMAPEDATPEEKKAAALAVAKAWEENQATLLARDAAWRLKVEHHNSLAEDVRRHEPQ